MKASVKETVPVTEYDSEPMTPAGPATPTCVLIESSSDGSESSNNACNMLKKADGLVDILTISRYF